MFTLFCKEFRDVVRWTPIGMILVTYLAWRSLPAGLHDCHNPSSNLIESMGIFSSATEEPQRSVAREARTGGDSSVD